MQNMSVQDAERLHALITRHAHYTNSAKAKTILADWPTWSTKFRKVMPIEYRRALSEMAKHQEANATGLDVLEIGVPTSSGKPKASANGKAKAKPAE
jgi:glutamate synthase (NADPH/NADH) large chain